jgi:hypothetical protein
MMGVVQFSNIDDDLINALRYDNYAWTKRIVGFGNIEVIPEENIGSRRTCDLLVSISNYDRRGAQNVAVEVENDREFDASAILRKIKKDQPCPTILILPIDKAKDAWRFQESMIKVWFWKCRVWWECRKCSKLFTTTSSITPSVCGVCQGKGQFDYKGPEPRYVKFVEADNNPTMAFGDIQDKLGRGYVII